MFKKGSPPDAAVENPLSSGNPFRPLNEVDLSTSSIRQSARRDEEKSSADPEKIQKKHPFSEINLGTVAFKSGVTVRTPGLATFPERISQLIEEGLAEQKSIGRAHTILDEIGDTKRGVQALETDPDLREGLIELYRSTGLLDIREKILHLLKTRTDDDAVSDFLKQEARETDYPRILRIIKGKDSAAAA